MVNKGPSRDFMPSRVHDMPAKVRMDAVSDSKAVASPPPEDWSIAYDVQFILNQLTGLSKCLLQHLHTAACMNGLASKRVLENQPAPGSWLTLT